MISQWAELKDGMDTALDSVLTGGVDPKKALDDLAAQIQGEIDKNGPVAAGSRLAFRRGPGRRPGPPPCPPARRQARPACAATAATRRSGYVGVDPRRRRGASRRSIDLAPGRPSRTGVRPAAWQRATRSGVQSRQCMFRPVDPEGREPVDDGPGRHPRPGAAGSSRRGGRLRRARPQAGQEPEIVVAGPQARRGAGRSARLDRRDADRRVLEVERQLASSRPIASSYSVGQRASARRVPRRSADGVRVTSIRRPGAAGASGRGPGRHAVGGQPGVRFDARRTLLDGEPEGLEGVLRRVRRGAAMGEGDGCRHASRPTTCQ